MNILVFSTVFHPAIGGLENQTLILIKEFIKQGHSVKVITEQKQLFPLKDLEVFETPGILHQMKLFIWCHVYYMPNISLKGVWPLFLNLAIFRRKKWIVSHNDFYLSERGKFRIQLKRFLIRFASVNISVSRSVARYINTGSAVIYNCYDESIFKLHPTENRIYDFVFLGRLVKQKGCDVLIQACKKLEQPFFLHIIGEGPERKPLEQLVKQLGLTQHIKFCGTLKGVELSKMLNQHKVMVVPSSDSEGFGIVVLEGLACGCKIIASDAAGLVEAVNNFGKLFSMNDVNGLAELMNESLNTDSQPVENKELHKYLLSHTTTVVSEKYMNYFDVQSGNHLS